MEKIVLKDLTPKQVELIRKMKKQYEETRGTKHETFCWGIWCRINKDRNRYCPFDNYCDKTSRQQCYQAICEYLDKLDNPTSGGLTVKECDELVSCLSDNLVKPDIVDSQSSLKYSDIESLTSSLNTFIDKCRSDKQFLMIKEVCDFREKLQAFGLQYNE